MEEVTVISVEEHEKLLSANETLEAFKEYVQKTQGSISREDCAKYLGFELPNTKRRNEDA